MQKEDAMVRLKETRFGFPFDSIPSGWYQVAWQDQIGKGGVLPLTYFGRDLVLFRNEADQYVVMDAYCLHYGAHLGHGGRVEGCDIVCPFHGWRWGPDGRNAWAPLDNRARPEVVITTYPTVVRNSIVWVWFDPEGAPPDWQIPEVAQDHRLPYPQATKHWEHVRAMPQYVIENAADGEHFRWVHRADGPISVDFGHSVPAGPIVNFKVKMVLGYGKDRTRLTPDGPVDATIDSQLWGIGVNFADFAEIDGALLIESHTPIDIDYVDFFVSVFLPRRAGDDGAELTGREQARVREQFVQLERDFPIWENMRYVQNPAYSSGEGNSFNKVRKWSRQFYKLEARKS
jgi:3-ketosteroid 9alpha-monooxygenase subunit A